MSHYRGNAGVCYRDKMRTRQQIMRSVAIGRVLQRAHDRSAIGSPRDLRLAYLNELAMHGEEIAAETYRILALARQAELAMTRKALRCVICGGTIGAPSGPAAATAPIDAGSGRISGGSRRWRSRFHDPCNRRRTLPHGQRAGRTSGLPMNIWIGTRGAQQAARIKVQPDHRERFDIDRLAVVGVEDPPEVKEGRLNTEDLELVRAISPASVLDHWNEKTD
jgi:hypothetical protein